MWGPIHSLNLNLLVVKGRSSLFLRLEVVKKIIGAVILCITIPFGLVEMCYGQVFASILFLFVNTYYTGKLIHVGFMRQMRDLFPTMFYTSLMGVSVWFLSSLFTSSFLQIIVGILFGIPLYLLISKVSKSQEYVFLLDMLRQNVFLRKRMNRRADSVGDVS